MRLNTLVGAVLLVVGASPAFAGRTILYYENECCRNITEGEFAILYAQGLRLREPAQGWTIQSAAAALSSLRHQPEGGWVLSRFVSEGVMAQLLKDSPFYRSPFTDKDFQKSEKLVTVSQARSVFPPEEGLTQGEFAVLLVQALRIASPQTGWTAESAAAVLAKQSPPLKPAAGWQITKVLKEWEMLQVLAPTEFRSTPIDPATGVSALQAYSLLFGKFEIATEGHFGLFVVNALGLPPPPGGWTKAGALDFVAKEFGLQSRYGWNADAPLCAEVFEAALRQILTKTQQGQGATKTGSAQPVRTTREGSVAAAQQKPAGTEGPLTRERNVERVVSELRASGLIPADRCAIIPALGLVQLGPLGRPPGGDVPGGHVVPPASTSVPPQ